MERIIIDIVGPPGSGKSSICSDLHEKYGFGIYRPSDVIRAYAKANNITLRGRQDYVTAHEALLAEDPAAIIRPVLESTAQRLCMDGMRSPIPFIKIREQIGATLIYLECLPEVQLARIQTDAQRTGHRQRLTMESLLADEAPDAVNPNRHLPNMIEMRQLADFVIDASGPYDVVLADICNSIGLQKGLNL